MVKLVHVNKVGTSGDLFVIREFTPPVGPDNTLPGGGGGGSTLPANPNFPNNTLPGGPPPHLPAGHTLVLVRDPAGVWHYAAIEPGQVVPPPIPDNTLPGTPAYPTGGPVPPVPTPT